MTSESWIICELLGALFLLGVLSFFRAPVYEKGAWLAISLFGWGVSLVLGYKFGRSMPQQAGDPRPGQSSETRMETATRSSDAPAAAKEG